MCIYFTSDFRYCKVVSEQSFNLDTDITINLKIGTFEKPDIVSTKIIKFVSVNNKVAAFLNIEYFSAPRFSWQTMIELESEDGKILGQVKTKGRNGIIEPDSQALDEYEQQLPFGLVENLSEVKKFKVTINQIEEKFDEETIKSAIQQKKNTYYGKILFKDGNPAVIKPQLWENAFSYVTIEPPVPNNPYHTYSGIGLKEGLFMLYLTDELLEILKLDKHNITISCPCYDDEGGRLYKQVGIFPVNLLVNDKSRANEFRVKRPEEINDCPITYATEWKLYDEYLNEILELHKEKYIADAEKMAEKVDWGESVNGLRCKLACSEQDIQTADPLFLMIYFQNMSKNDIKLRNSIGRIINISLNGNIVGKDHDGFGYVTFDIFESIPESITIKPGEIVKEPLPVAVLSYNRPLDDVGSHALTTSRPGVYNVQAIYPSGNSSNREANKVTSNVLVIKVEPRDKDIYEGQFILDRNLPLILYNGTENNPYLLKGDNIRFEKANDNVTAILKVSFETRYGYNWQTELEILDDDGTVLSKYQRRDDNHGKAKIIDREFRFTLGAWSDISNAKKFRISITPVIGK